MKLNGEISVQTLLDYGFLESITLRGRDDLEIFCSEKLKKAIEIGLEEARGKIIVYFDSCPCREIKGKIEQVIHTVLIPDSNSGKRIRLFGDTTYRSPAPIHTQVWNLRDTWIAHGGRFWRKMQYSNCPRM